MESCKEVLKYVNECSIVYNKVNKAECCSILADEIFDISGSKQFSMSIRYTTKDKNGKLTLLKDFLKFVPVFDLKGKALANTALDSLQELRVNIKYIREQGYDAAASTSGPFQGCAAIIREKFPQAVHLSLIHI